jgi:CRISPR-associated protein Cmr3
MKYKILLKPLEPYFFGGEQTFGKLGDKENGSYIAVSKYFPNQTALLGMLKKEILKNERLLSRKIRGEWVNKDKKEKAKEIVGYEKFSFENNRLLNYGKIRSIEPLFLQKGDEEFFAIKDIFSYEISLNPPLLKGFSAKTGVELKFFNANFTKNFGFGDVFEKKVQVGNKKIHRAGKSIKEDEKENAFFKKISFMLKEDWAFGFCVEVDDISLKSLDNSLVHLGADKGKFLMKIEENPKIEELKPPKREFDYILLLSDSYIDLPLKENCDFAITSETSLAFLENAFKNGKRKFKKSQKYYFYEKGSIIINPNEKLMKAIDRFKNLVQIGYNRYIPIGDKE